MELVSSPASSRIVTMGEGMIEISGGLGASGRVGHGGDVLNVSIALARLGHRPAFLTALGSDQWSADLMAAWQEEGIDTSLIARHPQRVPGLYGVTVDSTGERSFTYWRQASAARDLFALPETQTLLDEAGEADLLFLSGITLSLYDADGRAAILALAKGLRARGGDVVFDGNYRRRGWQDVAEARAAFDALAPAVSIALPTCEDETVVYGDTTPEAIAARWHAAGAREVVVKLGADGAYVAAAGDAFIVPTQAIRPIDTTGAGDAFDAGYISARLKGADPHAAALVGHRLAGITIRHPGAIPPRAAIVEGMT